MLSHEQIKKFQKIWKKLFGRDISDEDADREGSRLVRLVRLICEPTTKDKDIQNAPKELNDNKLKNN